MTLEEARTICENAAWTRKISLVKLFDELVEEAGNSNKVKGALGSYSTSEATGLIVAVILGLRREIGLKLYELSKKGKAKP